MSQNWVDQVKGSSGDDDDGDDGAAESLFQDNFRRLVNDDDVESLNVQTIKKQIEKIDDVELLEDAKQIDSRKGSTEAYEDRLAVLGADDESDEATGDAEGSAEPADDAAEESPTEADAGDAEESEDADGGAAWVDDVTNGETTDDETDTDAEETETNAAEDPDEGSGEGDAADEVSTDDAAGVSEPTVSDDGDDADEDDRGTADAIDGSSGGDGDSDGVTADGSDDSDLPDVNVGAIAPNAVSSDDAAQQESIRTLLVWGPEGTGKSHVAHSAPKPVCYIDTEGKADELAEKFDDVYYWQPEDYSEAKDALDDALEVLAAFREKGVTGTIVVDSMGVMWEWAQIHHMKLTRPSKESLDEVQFTSAFSSDGGGDWQKIKGYHNTEFRDVILESPYNVVFTAGRKEKYDFDGDTMDSRWEPEGEKRNKYAVKEVVRLRTDDQGRTVGDLHKAARTRYSFANLQWPEWDDIYATIDEIATAEQAPEPVDTSQWEFDIYEGQPLADGSEGGDGDD